MEQLCSCVLERNLRAVNRLNQWGEVVKHLFTSDVGSSYITICVFQLHFCASVAAFRPFDEEMRRQLNFQCFIQSRTHGRFYAGVVGCANKDATMRRAGSRVMAVTFSLAPFALWYSAAKRPRGLHSQFALFCLLLTIMMLTVVSSKFA